MVNCRSISEATWVKAHQRLVFYFSRGRGFDRAADLAQETLAAVWRRPDYEFESEEDFIAVCLGFARNIAYQDRRDAYRYSGGVVNPDMPVPESSPESQSSAEFRVLFGQILEAAKANLAEGDYQLILQAVYSNSRTSRDPQEANRRRVSLHRAIRRLARLLGRRDQV